MFYLRKFPVDRVLRLVLHRLTPLHFDVSSNASVRSCENCSIFFNYKLRYFSIQMHRKCTYHTVFNRMSYSRSSGCKARLFILELKRIISRVGLFTPDPYTLCVVLKCQWQKKPWESDMKSHLKKKCFWIDILMALICWIRNGKNFNWNWNLATHLLGRYTRSTS